MYSLGALSERDLLHFRPNPFSPYQYYTSLAVGVGTWNTSLPRGHIESQNNVGRPEDSQQVAFRLALYLRIICALMRLISHCSQLTEFLVLP